MFLAPGALLDWTHLIMGNKPFLYWKPLKGVCCISSGSALFAMINAIFRDWSTHLFRKSTCDPFKHIMDTPILTVAFCSAEWNHLCNYCRGHYVEQFYENILNLGQWFRRRCHLKDFLSGALAALLLGGAEPFMQFWKRASWATVIWSYMKFGPKVQEMSFKEKVNGRTTGKDW